MPDPAAERTTADLVEVGLRRHARRGGYGTAVRAALSRLVVAVPDWLWAFQTGVGGGTMATIRSTTWAGEMLSATASKPSTMRWAITSLATAWTSVGST